MAVLSCPSSCTPNLPPNPLEASEILCYENLYNLLELYFQKYIFIINIKQLN